MGFSRQEYWSGLLFPSLGDLLNQGIEPGDFSGTSSGKESACNEGDSSSIPGSGRSAGEGIGYPLQYSWASLCGSAGKESAFSAGVLGLIPGLQRSPGEGKGYPFQYPGLENSIDCIFVCSILPFKFIHIVTDFFPFMAE